MHQRGFTLIEIVLVIALITTIGAITVPVSSTLQTQNDLAVTLNYATSSLRRAQILSQSGEQDATWGVKVQQSQIVIFKGLSYAARDQRFDEVIAISPAISFSGMNEIVYAKLSGLPTASGAMTISTSANNTRTITISNKGILAY